MAAFNFRRRRTRRGWYAGVSLVIAMFLGIFFVAGASGNIGTSPFQGGDGNMIVDPGSPAGSLDWANVGTATTLNTGTDQSASKTDDAFGQGTKEDNPAVTIVDGSIPPNKNDLTHFMEASQVIGTGASQKVYLYLGWERLVNIGNANLDFEINQNPTAGWTSTTTGAITINRTPGDVLVTYDFSGSGVPTIGVNRWVVSATNPAVPGVPTNTCFSANTFPCWGDHVNMSSAGLAEGAVNTGNITDSVFGGTLGAGLFGETSIDLTAAGVFTPGQCSAFGSTFLKSRSSSSFTAEIKDIIAPTPVDITNCGEVKIIKHSDPRGQDKAFSFTSNLAGATMSCSQPSPSTAQSFTLNDVGNTGANPGDSAGNTQDCTNVPAGNYTVNEPSEPPGFSFEGLSCSQTGGGSGAQDATVPTQANITVVPGSVVTCTYQNQAQAEIKIIKHTSPRGINQSFSYSSSVPGNTSFSLNDSAGVDNSTNTKDITNIAPGSYTVNETEPGGWTLGGLSCTGSDAGSSGTADSTTPTQANITVDAGGLVTCTYTNNQPLGAILITKTGKDVACATAASTISNGVCTGVHTAKLGGAKFSVTGTDLLGNAVSRLNQTTSNSTGTVCVGNLPWNGAGTNYTVAETGAPGGYDLDSALGVTVLVNANASCNAAGTGFATGTTGSSQSFSDTPLTDISVNAHAEAAGATNSQITCSGTSDDGKTTLTASSGASASDPANASQTALHPGTYSCTIVIDP